MESCAFGNFTWDEREKDDSRQPLRNAKQVAVMQFGKVEDVSFSPDGSLLAVVGEPRMVRILDATRDGFPELTHLRKNLEDPGEEDMFAVAFSPDGAMLASSGTYAVHLWHLDRKEPTLFLRQHKTWVYSVAFSPHGQYLASGGADCHVCLWNARTGALLAEYQEHREPVYKVAFSPDSSLLLSCGADGSVVCRNVLTGKRVETLRIEGPYEGLNLTGVQGLTAAQKLALRTLGAREGRSMLRKDALGFDLTLTPAKVGVLLAKRTHRRPLR